MSRPVYIVTAGGEERLAELLAVPLRAAGFMVAHNGTVAVGESHVGEATKALHSGSPVVLYATLKAIGSRWAHQLVNAAHAMTVPRVFVVQMDAEAFVGQLSLHTQVARYCDDPEQACRDLIAAISKHCPPPPAAPSAAEPAAGQFLDRPTEMVSFDIDALARFRAELRPEALARFPGSLAPWEFLSRTGLLKGKFLTGTGMLLVGSAPADVLPSAMIQCAHYRGRDRSATHDVLPIAGTVPRQIVDARQFVADRVRRGEAPSSEQAQATPRYAYPMIAVREVIANAVAHRDYERTDACVSVRLFDDRLEVSSPGSWHGQSVTEEVRCDLARLEGESRHRNFWLAHVLTWIWLVECEGSGIPSAMADCRRENAPSPEVLLRDGEVTVVIRPSADDDSEETAARRSTFAGKLSIAELAEIRSCYVRPSSHEQAIQALTSRSFLILSGPQGIGKRTGAINLLLEATDGPLVLLSPVYTLQQLAERSYLPGHGYVLADRVGADDGIHWDVIGSRVREAGAHLVVTTSAGVNAVAAVEWHRPDVMRVLRARLAATGHEYPDQLDAIAPVLPHECSLRSVVELARRIAAGADPEQAVKQVDEVIAMEVRAWFDRPPAPRELLEVTALAFVEGAGVRGFETLEAGLEQFMSEEFPAAIRPKPATGIPQERVRSDERELIRVERGTVSFKLPGHRRLALAELWARFDRGFWQTVWRWLRGVAGHPDLAGLPQGLALLASLDFTEVRESFLEPCSAGEQGAPEQAVVVEALRLMSIDYALAVPAMEMVIRWVREGTVDQRRTAALVLGADLGERFYADAVRELGMLSLTDDLRDPACTALAALLIGGAADDPLVRSARIEIFGRMWAQVLMNGRTRREAGEALLAVVKAIAGQSDAPETLGSVIADALSPDSRLSVFHDLRVIAEQRTEDVATFLGAFPRSTSER
ncbi:ATP-binding protein [Actinoplanes sp. NPDC026619]|uniref:ATP-binding protein n=1 Tax=Actinoplanes sp. NPDC026619 TaxID=3155798 RepID=UPI0033E23887